MDAEARKLVDSTLGEPAMGCYLVGSLDGGPWTYLGGKLQELYPQEAVAKQNALMAGEMGLDPARWEWRVIWPPHIVLKDY